MGEVVSLAAHRRAVNMFTRREMSGIDMAAARMMAAVLEELADYVPAPEHNDVPDDDAAEAAVERGERIW